MRKPVTTIIGILNLLFATVGIYVECQTFSSTQHIRNTEIAPFTIEVFDTMTAINLLLMVALALAGYFLLRLRSGAVTFCNLVFTAEILYVVLLMALPFQGPVGQSISAAAGVGSVALMVQALVGYPLVGIVLLRFSQRRLRQSGL
jgi:hypothetical protein